MHTHDGHDHAQTQPSGDIGALIHWPRRYDLLASAMLLGRGRRLRSQIARELGMAPGHRVLDVGCGTGTLTLALASVVGPAGWAGGVDASPEMIAAATAKATGRHPATTFQVAAAQQLPFADDSVDAVVTSLMIHHLPSADRASAVVEMFRVLRPDGHLVIVEFQPPTGRVSKAVVRHVFGHTMADNDLGAIVELTKAAGGVDVDLSATPVSWLGMVRARKSGSG